jgi:hypothetical protein
MSRYRARAGVFLVTLTLAGIAVTGTALASSAAAGAAAAPAPAATAPTAGQAASGWLARQMVSGSHFVTVYEGVSYPSQGETIDAVLAFAATKSATGYGARAMGWLSRPGVLSNYVGSGTESYAGATAKLALAAEVRGLDPARFGGVNLIKRLDALLRKNGRYSDHSTYGDFSNAFSQSLAIIALSRDGGVPAKAVRFLIASECKNGGFPLDFGQKTCVSDTDATAMDVQAVLAAGQRAGSLPGPDLKAADSGLAWLARVQHRDGGLDAAGGTVPNANTTGLAGEAFAAGGWSKQASLARNFLLSLQVGCSAAKTAPRGAIAYDSTGFVRSTAIDATAQGILGLADVGLAKLSSRGSAYGDPRLECAA